jgi:dinuclear metal center YbgI/SA1388 family protein
VSVPVDELVSYLDEYLQHASVPDYPGAHNGLQVQGSRPVSRIVAAVDASQASIDGAVTSGAQLLLVHHGLLWDGGGPVVGRRWRRLGELIRHDVAVYSSHLPLDRHPVVGNNIQLATALGLRVSGTFGRYEGCEIGIEGEIECSRADLSEKLEAVLGSPPHVIPGGPDPVRRVGVITGGAGSMIGDAVASGLDTFVTGEGAHHTHFDGMESGVNVLYGGHYATETFGVKALAAHVADRFQLEWQFFDHPTGL